MKKVKELLAFIFEQPSYWGPRLILAVRRDQMFPTIYECIHLGGGGGGELSMCDCYD